MFTSKGREEKSSQNVFESDFPFRGYNEMVKVSLGRKKSPGKKKEKGVKNFEQNLR